MSEENRDERFLVVMTTDELLHARTSLMTMKVMPIILPGISGAVPVGQEEEHVRHAPVGKLVLRLGRIAPQVSRGVAFDGAGTGRGAARPSAASQC